MKRATRNLLFAGGAVGVVALLVGVAADGRSEPESAFSFTEEIQISHAVCFAYREGIRDPQAMADVVAQAVFERTPDQMPANKRSALQYLVARILDDPNRCDT